MDSLNSISDLSNKGSINYSDLGKQIQSETKYDNIAPQKLPTITSSYQTPVSIDLKDYRRFTASDAFPKLGIDPLMSQREMEREYDATQSMGEAFGNMTGKFLSKTWNSAAGVFSADFGTHQTLIDEQYKLLKKEKEEEIYNPTFDSRTDETRNSILQWVPGFEGSADNYEQFLPNLGYTVGTLLGAGAQTALIGSLTEGAGLVETLPNTISKVGKAFNLLRDFNKIEPAAMQVISKFDKIKSVANLKTGLEGYTLYSTAASESAMEAAHTGQSTYDKNVQQFYELNGYMPFGSELDKIKNDSYSAAKTTYMMNMPILLLSNYAQFKNILMPTGSKAINNLLQDAEKGYVLTGKLGSVTYEAEKPFMEAWRAANKTERFKMAAGLMKTAYKPVKSSLMEGGEESFQRFASSFSEDYYTTKREDRTIGKSLQYGVTDMLSAQGMQEFIGGAITGAITGGIGKISDVTGISDKVVPFLGGETKAQKEEKNKQYRDNILNTINNSSIDFALKDGGFLDAFRSVLLSKDTITFNTENNLFEASNTRHLGLYNMVWNSLMSGKQDFIKERLNNLGDNEDLQSLAQKMGISVADINVDNLKSFTSSIVGKIDEVNKNFKNVVNHFSNLGIEQDLVTAHNRAVITSQIFDTMIRKKYNIPAGEEAIKENWEKISEEDRKMYNDHIDNLQKAKINLYAYKEAVKVAAISYQGLNDDKLRIDKLTNELNTNDLNINYTDSINLLDNKTLRQLRQEVKLSLDLAVEEKDRKKLEKQLEIIKKAEELNRKGLTQKDRGQIQENANEMARLMHELAKLRRFSDLTLNDANQVEAFEKTSNYLQKLADMYKLEKQQKQNLDVYNYLMNADNFEEYRRYSYEKMAEFFAKVAEWQEEMSKNPELAPPVQETKKEEDETTKDETPGTEEITPSKEIKEEVEEINKKEGLDKFDIKIVKDENGKHYVEVSYKSSVYGEVSEEKRKEIEKDYRATLDKLDAEEQAKKAKEKDIADAQTIIDQYTPKLEDYKNIIITNEEKQKIIDDYVDAMSMDPDNLPEAMQDKLFEILDVLRDIKVAEDMEQDSEEEDGYVPEAISLAQIKRESGEDAKETTDKVVSGKLSYETTLRTASNEAERIVDPIGEKISEDLKKDTYTNFLRKFKNFLAKTNLGNLFVSSSFSQEDGATLRLVVTKDTKDLQLQTFGEELTRDGKILSKGHVILVQALEDGVWKTAYFDNGFNLSTEKTAENKPITFAFVAPEEVSKINRKELAKIRKDKGLNKTVEEAEEFFARQDEQNRQLRKAAETEPQPIYFENISKGIILNERSAKQSAINLVTDIDDPQIKIAEGKKIGEKKQRIVNLGGRKVLSGTVHLKLNDEFVQIYPEQLTDAIKKQVDELLNHTYKDVTPSPDSSVPKEIGNVINYLSSLIYTKKNLRSFSFNLETKKIEMHVYEYKDKSRTTKVYNSIEEYEEKEKYPLYFNVSKSRLEGNSTTYKIEDGKLVSETMSTSDYVKFVLKNSTARGTFSINEDGRLEPIYVNRHISFSTEIKGEEITGTTPTESTEQPTTSEQTGIREEDKKTVEEIRSNQERVKKPSQTKNGKYNIDNEDYERTSNVLPDTFDGDKLTTYGALNAGQVVDTIVKEALDGKSLDEIKESEVEIDHKKQVKEGDAEKVTLTKKKVKVKDMIADQPLKEIIKFSEAFGKLLKDRNETIVGSSIVVWDTKTTSKTKVAGEIDILTIDSNGKYRIYDIKTTKDYSKIDKSYEGRPSSLAKYTSQLSMYATLLKRQYGIDVEELVIVPLQISRTDAGEVKSHIPKPIIKLNQEDVSKYAPLSDDELSNGGFENTSKEENDDEERITDKDSLFSTREEEEKFIDDVITAASNEELEALRLITDRAGIKLLFRAANSQYWGQFTTSAVILYGNTKEGTGYHESFHVFSQMFLTKSEKLKMYKEAKKRVERIKEFSPIQVEEFLANDFKRFRLTGESEVYGKKKNSVFQRMLDFLKRIFGGGFNIEKAYDDLKKGNFYDYKPSVDNAFWGKLNSEKGFENLPISKLIKYSRHADCELGQIMINPLSSGKNKGIVLSDLFTLETALANPKVAKNIVDELRIRFENLAAGSSKAVATEIDTILDNWKDFLKFNSEYSRNSYVEIVEAVEENDDTKTRDSVYNKGANEESSFAMGRDSIKQLMMLVPRCVWKNGTYKVVKDRNGIMEPANTVVLWNTLSSEMNNELRIDKFYEKLNSKEIRKKIPEIGYIIDNLLPKSFEKKAKIDLHLAFFNAFSKPYVAITTTVETRDGQWFQKYETKNNREAIQKRAIVNFQSFNNLSKFVKVGVIAKNDDKRNYLTKEFSDSAYPNLDLNTNDSKFYMLELLGFNIPRTLSIDAKERFDDLTDALATITDSLKERIDRGQEITDPVSQMKSGFMYTTKDEKGTKIYVTIEGESSSIEKILSFVSDFTVSDPSMSYRGANGKMKYGIQEFNRITRTNYWLSTVNSYEEILQSRDDNNDFTYLDVDNYANSRGSLYLKMMFNKTALDGKSKHNRTKDISGRPITVLIESYDGYQLQDTESKDTLIKKEVYKLNEREKARVDFNTFLTTGKINMLQPASKRTYYSMRISTNAPLKSANSPLYITLEEARDAATPYSISKFTDVWKGYLEAELFKVGTKKYQDMKLDKFTYFDFLDEKLKNKLKAEASKVKDDNFMKVVDKNMVEINEAMNKYFKDRAKEIQLKFDSLGIDPTKDISKDLIDNYSMDQLIDAFVMNHYIVAMEEMKLFQADPQYYSDFFKRLGQNISTGTHGVVFDEMLEYLETDDYSFASALTNKTATQRGKDYSKLSFLTIADQLLSAEKETQLPILDAVTDKTSVTPFAKGVSKLVADAAYSYNLIIETLTGKSPGYTDAVYNKINKEFVKDKYDEVNVTDGGGYCTVDSYRRIMMAVNNWSDEQEALYRALSIKYRLANNFYKTPAEKQNAEKYMDLCMNKAEGAVFNVAKFQVNAITIINGVEVPILHKFSLAPIIWDQVKDKELANLHNEMLIKDIDYVAFKSSSKSYTPSITDLIKNGSLVSDFDSDSKVNMQMSDIKEQILTASEYKDGKSFGVQMAQLAFTNLFENGVPIGFTGTVEEFEKTDYDDLSDIGKAYRDYVNSFEEIREENTRTLFSELGIKERENGDLYINDSKKLVKKLHSLASQRLASSNVFDYVAYDPKTKNFSNPLDFSLNIDEIKKLVHGLIDRRLRKMKVNGSMSVQVPDFGQRKLNHNFRNATAEEKIKYGANGLPFYYLTKDEKGNVITAKMGVKVTMSGSYLNLLNRKDVIKYAKEKGVTKIEAINALLEDENWRKKNEDVLTIVGYRIPTQGPNSMDIMVIHEFLPDYMGNTIILPAGITTKSGADYDIDKMSLFFKNISKSGEEIVNPSSERKIKIIDSIKKDRKTLDKLQNELFNLNRVLNVDKKELEELQNFISENFENLDQISSGESVFEGEEEIDVKQLIKEYKKQIKSYIKSLQKVGIENISEDKKKEYEETLEKISKLESANEEPILQETNEQKKERLANNIEKTIADMSQIEEKVDALFDRIEANRLLIDKKLIAQNKMMNALESILTNPLMFYHMVKPNNTEEIESIAALIGNKTGRGINNFGGSSVIRWLSSLIKHDELQEAKELLGGWATGNKFLQNLIISNFLLRNFVGHTRKGLKLIEEKEEAIYILESKFKANQIDKNTYYKEGLKIEKKYNEQIEKEKIISRNPLLTTQQERDIKKNNLYQLGKILSLDKDENNLDKFAQDIFNEAINMTVDVEGKPFARQLGINSINTWVAIYLGLKRVPTKQTWLFLNQPVLAEYYSRLNKTTDVNSPVLQKEVLADIINDYFSNAVPFEITEKNVISFLQRYVSVRKNLRFDQESMESYLTKTPSKDLAQMHPNSPMVDDQLAILAYFISANEETKILQKVRTNTSFDSKKINSVREAYDYSINISDLQDSKLYPFFENAKSYFQRSIANRYNETKTVVAVNNKLFPIISNKTLTKGILGIPSFRIKGKSTEERMKKEKIVLNDFVASLIQNFGFGSKENISELSENTIVISERKKGAFIILEKTSEDTYKAYSEENDNIVELNQDEIVPVSNMYTLSEFVTPLIRERKKSKDTDMLYDRLNIIKTDPKYKEIVEQYSVIDRLLLNTTERDKFLRNIELYRSDANEKADQDSYIQQFKELCTNEDSFVSGVFQDLMLVAFYQSGYNLSSLYFTDILNYNAQLLGLIENANRTYKLMEKNAPELLESYMLLAMDKVKSNNPQVYTLRRNEEGKVIERDSLGNIIKPNYNYTRGRDLTVNMEIAYLETARRPMLTLSDGTEIALGIKEIGKTEEGFTEYLAYDIASDTEYALYFDKTDLQLIVGKEKDKEAEVIEGAELKHFAPVSEVIGKVKPVAVASPFANTFEEAKSIEYTDEEIEAGMASAPKNAFPFDEEDDFTPSSPFDDEDVQSDIFDDEKEVEDERKTIDDNSERINADLGSDFLVSFESLKNNPKFRGKDVSLVDKIETKGKRTSPVAARNDGEKILISEKEMIKKYEEKAWTKSKTLADGSEATALPLNMFNSFNEWLTFTLLHENFHFTIKKEINETIGEYEDRINQAALNEMEKSFIITPKKVVNTVDKRTEPLAKVRTFSGYITELKPNQVAVVGVNPEGRHGKGNAKTVGVDLGKLEMGQIRNNKVFGIITKDLMGYMNYDKKLLQVLPYGDAYYTVDGITFYGNKVVINGQRYEKPLKTPSEGRIREGQLRKATDKLVANKNIRWRHKLPKEAIVYQIMKLYEEAKANPEKEYLVAYIGTEAKNNNGYTQKEMAEMFSSLEIPANVVFEENFASLLKAPKVEADEEYFNELQNDPFDEEDDLQYDDVGTDYNDNTNDEFISDSIDYNEMKEDLFDEYMTAVEKLGINPEFDAEEWRKLSKEQQKEIIKNLYC